MPEMEQDALTYGATNHGEYRLQNGSYALNRAHENNRKKVTRPRSKRSRCNPHDGAMLCSKGVTSMSIVEAHDDDTVLSSAQA